MEAMAKSMVRAGAAAPEAPEGAKELAR